MSALLPRALSHRLVPLAAASELPALQAADRRGLAARSRAARRPRRQHPESRRKRQLPSGPPTGTRCAQHRSSAGPARGYRSSTDPTAAAIAANISDT